MLPMCDLKQKKRPNTTEGWKVGKEEFSVLMFSCRLSNGCGNLSSRDCQCFTTQYPSLGGDPLEFVPLPLWSAEQRPLRNFVAVNFIECICLILN